MTTSERAEREASLKVLLRCSSAVFLVHDLEEILKIKRFWGENRDCIPIPAGLKSRIEATTTAQMAAAVAFVFAASCYPSSPAARSPIPGAKIGFFNTMISIRLPLNALLHLLQTLALRSYAPGTVTALLVSLPYSLYVFHWLSTRRMCLPLVTCTERWS